MNEYTRREEVRWILLSAVTLVACVGGAMGFLVTAKGSVEPDPAARTAADAAAKQVQEIESCSVTVGKLSEELPQFRKIEETAQAPVPPPEPPKPPVPQYPRRWQPPAPPEPKKKVEDNSGLAWPGAQPTYQRAKALAPCRDLVSEGHPLSDDAAVGWKAISDTAAVEAPAEGDKAAEIAAAKRVYELLGKAPIDAVAASVAQAKESLTSSAADADAHAKTATIRKPLPKGLLGREAAIGAGVLISLVALLVHFFSLRATSMRRAATLLALRPSAATTARGLQAAAILRLASESNGGEPGIVIGCALGGLAAAIVARQDADWFVVGVMGGLVVGLLVQIAVRFSGGGETHFRARTLELSEVEKPTVPIVLVLSSIETGREGEFLDAFLRLPQDQQAESVDKLAQQAEERILVAADAQADAKAMR